MRKPDPALAFPPARRDPGGHARHGRWFDDPYAWLDHLDDPDTRAWIAAQEAVTRALLDAVPGRDCLRAAVTRSARHARLSPPIRTATPGRELLWQADAGDDKLKLMLRRGEGAPPEPLLDPNTWASDEARRSRARPATPACPRRFAPRHPDASSSGRPTQATTSSS